MQRPVATDVEALLRSSQSLKVRGIVAIAAFVDYLRATVASDWTSEAGGILTVLEPVPSLKARQALTQSQLRRFGGDVICEARHWFSSII